jgi:hypothetical protein
MKPYFFDAFDKLLNAVKMIPAKIIEIVLPAFSQNKKASRYNDSLFLFEV